MIAAYAQAAERQGIDAAMNGHPVPANEPEFSVLRRKAVTLNLEGTPSHAGEAEVSSGQGVVRLELLGIEDGAADLSPVVVVVEIEDLLQDRTAAVKVAMQCVTAIGREIDSEAAMDGLAEGERIFRAARMRRRIVALVAVGLVAVALAWIARGLAASS